MATTFALQKSTPHSLIYTVTGDGVAGTRTGAAILADCAAGPLKTALARELSVASGGTGAVNAMDKFNLPGAASARVRTRVAFGIAGAQTMPGLIEYAWSTTGLAATLPNLTAMNVEIRFQHSEDR